MRFVWAVVAFVLAAVLIGTGIAQRTVLQGPRSETMQIAVDDAAPYTLVDGSVMGILPGSQTLRAQGDGTIFAAYGRTTDMRAWLSDATYNFVTLDDDGQLDVVLMQPEPASPTDGTTDADEASAPADETAPGRSPAGSDLWLDEFVQEDVLITPLQLPESMSLLIASDGTAPAPSRVSLSWPIVHVTPWAGPLMVLGGIFMAIGVVLYVLALRNVKRSRGPRRKGLPVSATEPIDLAVEGADKGVISSGKPRREIGGKRPFVVLPILAVSALAFTGCAPEAWPAFEASPTPTPTATVLAPEDQQQPAVTEAQAARILEEIAETAAQADEALDPELAATRLDGPVLAERETNYRLRAALPEYAVPPAVASKPIDILLPQAYDGWPRTVMAVVTDEDDKSASIMLMAQADPWSDYKLTHQSDLEAATKMPDLAPPYIGAAQVPPDSAFLLMSPQDLPAAYADVLNNGDDSEYAGLFEMDGDRFRAGVTADRTRRLEDFNKTGTNTATLTFDAVPGTFEPVALATVPSGSIVAVTIDESDTVKPTNPDAVIKLGSNDTVKTLIGADQSASGVTTVFNDQLFFYVPAQGSSERIRLLGYSSAILDAKVIE